MSNTVTKESDPELWLKLCQMWRDQGAEASTVVGPGGQQFKVHTPSDDVVLFSPRGGIDGAYNTRSTKGIAPE